MLQFKKILRSRLIQKDFVSGIAVPVFDSFHHLFSKMYSSNSKRGGSIVFIPILMNKLSTIHAMKVNSAILILILRPKDVLMQNAHIKIKAQYKLNYKLQIAIYKLAVFLILASFVCNFQMIFKPFSKHFPSIFIPFSNHFQNPDFMAHSTSKLS